MPAIAQWQRGHSELRRWMFKTSSYKRLFKPLKRLENGASISLEVSRFPASLGFCEATQALDTDDAGQDHRARLGLAVEEVLQHIAHAVVGHILAAFELLLDFLTGGLQQFT